MLRQIRVTADEIAATKISGKNRTAMSLVLTAGTSWAGEPVMVETPSSCGETAEKIVRTDC